MLQSVLMEEGPFKIVRKSYDVIDTPTLNAFGFYRFTSRCNSLALIYITKDFEWSPIRQFVLHSCMAPSGLR